ncbi:MAG: type I-C CRISPR-associated protein Cas5c [Eubacteriales bacterium]|nr:type I-C CRISPR-associated protein Cas5c [Eubacteriales bacterium]
MQLSVKVEVWGPYALFSRPELKTERYSYDVMTPSAARGLLEAVYMHPGIRWRIDRIHVLNPIAFASVRRNEVKSKVVASSVAAVMKGGGGELYLATSQDIQQRASTLLRDVHYVIEAHFDMTDKAAPGDNPGKFADIMRRRLEKGQCYHQPYFGCREFPAYFRKWEGDEPVTAYPEEDRDLGLMLYDMDYTDPENITPMFFRAALQKGVLNVPAPDSGEVLR